MEPCFPADKKYIYLSNHYRYCKLSNKKNCIPLGEVFLKREVLRTYRTVPEELKDVIEDEKYENYRVLAQYRSGFQLFKDTIGIGIATTFIFFNGFRTFWGQSGEILQYLGFNGSHEILQNALFLTMLNSCTFLINLPFAVYENYVTQGHYTAIHNVTMSGALFSYVVTQMFVFPFVCLIFGLIKLAGGNVFLYVFYFAELQALLNMSNLDMLDPLPDCELRSGLVDFLDKHTDFPLYDIYVVRFPIFKRHHSQVYICGSTGRKIVVLYDSIAAAHRSTEKNNEERVSVEEIIALVVHEMGHWTYGHSYVYFIVNQIYLCVHLLSLHWLMNYQPMYRAFGFNDKPYAVGLVLMQYYPISELCSFLIRVVNRKLEFCADRYAKRLRKDRALITAIAKLGDQSSEFPVQDWLYSCCKNTQPSCHERIMALNAYNP